MNILAVSDVELGVIYSPQIARRFGHINLAIGCGDLPYYYLEYIISTLDIPLYYVRGNHSSQVESGSATDRSEPWGAIDLHRRVLREPTSGVLMAGIEGSIRYNSGEHQYTQSEMWNMVFLLVPKLFYNRLRYGRFLDLFITHAPPWKIHDLDDRPHQGIKAFNWFIKVFRPAYHLHGHVHIYRADTIRETRVAQTQVINTYGYRELTIDLPHSAELQAAGKKPPRKEQQA
jgi:Icc-related predicted phosphoesterase